MTNPAIARMKRATPELVKGWVKKRMGSALGRRGIVVTRLDDEGKLHFGPSFDETAPLPDGARERLRPDHPRLRELISAYDHVDSPAAVPTQWSDRFLAKDLSLAHFRGDNAYLWQFRLFGHSARTRTYLTLLDVASRDNLGLLDSMSEDGLFGAYSFTYGRRPPVSRDVLDSVNEINYLNTHMGLAGIENATVLDIGAGYGRLAHRMLAALPNVARYDCTDAVPISTFLCEYYTGFRGLGERCRVVPLHEVDQLADHYSVAVNVHSFSECSHAAVSWWLGQIADRHIPWLLIVPNEPGKLLSTEVGGSRIDFMPEVLAAGYELVDHRRVYESEELAELIDNDHEFFLYRRTAGPD